MSDKTGKVVHLKQAKEEKPGSKVKDIAGENDTEHQTSKRCSS